MLREARPRVMPPPLGLLRCQLPLEDSAPRKGLEGDSGGSTPRSCIMEDDPFISARRMGELSELAREEVSPAARRVWPRDGCERRLSWGPRPACQLRPPREREQARLVRIMSAMVKPFDMESVGDGERRSQCLNGFVGDRVTSISRPSLTSSTRSM
mmetsp:Transcript_19098/g.52892  ORF Transcript_19098/g.52892 Transcript_19098/m.52892 type:complete len:156 (-) Transcript_19098:104-571(-)